MKKINIKNIRETMRETCRIFNFRYEYPHSPDPYDWIIVSDLSEDELRSRYPDEMRELSPYCVIGKEYLPVRTESKRNEDRYYQRGKNNDCGYGFENDLMEIHHVEISEQDYATKLEQRDDEAELLHRLKIAVEHLPRKQRQRIIDRYCYNLSPQEIASIEGISYQAVYKSYERIMNNLKTKIEKG